MRPLTRIRPKALCPVGNTALVDIALGHVAGITDRVAVNVHHGRALMEEHLAGRVHLSIEPDEALGTAGALGHLLEWIDGSAALVVNADTWHQADLRDLVEGWDGERIRVLVEGAGAGGLHPGVGVVASLMPWTETRRLTAEPTGLYEVSWRVAAEEGRLETVGYRGPFIPCDQPNDYLAANMAASGGQPVVGPGADVRGRLVRSVVWPGGVVRDPEVLVDAIRVGDRLTVLCR
jgi:N-acetyl-alpha-D-muramate 1-phosphate uridylyltransferase